MSDKMQLNWTVSYNEHPFRVPIVHVNNGGVA